MTKDITVAPYESKDDATFLVLVSVVLCCFPIPPNEVAAV